MSNKKLVLPVSYTNIGDNGGLKCSVAGAAIHPPVAPITTTQWLEDLSADLPEPERKLVRFACELDDSGKHLGWALEADGRVLKWSGRYDVAVEAEVSTFPELPKKKYVGLAEVRSELRVLGDSFYEVMNLIRFLDTPNVTRYVIPAKGYVDIYDPFARTLHQIRIIAKTKTNKISGRGLWE